MGDAPTPDEPTSAGGGANVQALSIDALEPGPFQPRRNMAPGAMAELVESVKARGILQPLLARRDPMHARYQSWFEIYPIRTPWRPPWSRTSKGRT
jgi:hypothetical protein